MDIGLARQLKIGHLRLINAFSEPGELSVAAEQLAITQPAASRILAETETIVGEKLFERHLGEVTPTLVGKAVS